LNIRAYQFFEQYLILFWDDIEEIKEFLKTVSFMTKVEFMKKYGNSNTIKFKTKKHTYTIEFTLSSDIVNLKTISRK
jgi:hypothetical protein